MKSMSSIMLGCSPFVGARQFGPRAHQYAERFAKPENIQRVWDAFCIAGGRALHLVDYRPLWDAWVSWPGRHQTDVSLTISAEPSDDWLREVAEFGGTRVILHARRVDSGESLASFAERARHYGLEPWASTHQPFAMLTTCSDLDTVAGVLLPFNPLGVQMDAPPERVVQAAREHAHNVVAMMALGAGQVAFPDGVAFAGQYFSTVIAGTGDAEHAAQIAILGRYLDLLRPEVTVRRVCAPEVDVSTFPDQVTFMLDHRGMTIRGTAVDVWIALERPCTVADLVNRFPRRHLDMHRNDIEAAVGGLVLRLAAWGLIAEVAM